MKAIHFFQLTHLGFKKDEPSPKNLVSAKSFSHCDNVLFFLLFKQGELFSLKPVFSAVSAEGKNLTVLPAVSTKRLEGIRPSGESLFPGN